MGNSRFKFRVWFAPNWQKPEMIYEAEHTYDNRCRNKGSFHHESFGEILEDRDCILMQSTGLKDKNGKLIYEGDIVRDECSEAVATIEYLPYTFSLMAHIRGMDDYLPLEDICYALEVVTPFEVIGNIYENPELLEVEQ